MRYLKSLWQFNWHTRPRKHLQLGISYHADTLYLAALDLSQAAHPQLYYYDALPITHMPLSLSLQSFIKRHHLQRVTGMSVLDIADYHLLLVDMPPVPAAELTAALRWRVQDLIDFPINEAVLDVFELPNTTTNAQQKLLYVVVAPQDRVQQHSTTLLEGGIKLNAIDIPELALRNLASFLPEDRAGVATLWFSEGHSVLILTCKGQLYLARTLEIGVNALWDLLQDASLPAIDSQITAFTQNIALQQAVQRICVEIQRSLDYYENTYLQPPIGQLRLAPFKHALPGFCELLGKQLEMDVKNLDLNQLLTCEHKLSRAEQSQYLLAIGAGLRTKH